MLESRPSTYSTVCIVCIERWGEIKKSGGGEEPAYTWDLSVGARRNGDFPLMENISTLQ